MVEHTYGERDREIERQREREREKMRKREGDRERERGREREWESKRDGLMEKWRRENGARFLEQNIRIN